MTVLLDKKHLFFILFLINFLFSLFSFIIFILNGDITLIELFKIAIQNKTIIQLFILLVLSDITVLIVAFLTNNSLKIGSFVLIIIVMLLTGPGSGIALYLYLKEKSDYDEDKYY